MVDANHEDEVVRLTDVRIREADRPEVRFTSGRFVLLESLVDGRWIGRYWSADGRVNWSYGLWSGEAFQLELDYTDLSRGWTWVAANEVPHTEQGARHFVVEMTHPDRRVTLTLHTLLDGTPVMTRWLDIRNDGDASTALTAVSPWSGRLWAQSGHRFYPPDGLDAAFHLGWFSESDWGWEGWFEWQALDEGPTVIECDKGQGFDDPFFVVRNTAKGEHLIGHLAWSANWRVEFECQTNVDRDYERRWGPLRSEAHDFLSFRLGPTAATPQRVIAPGETIRTPAVHLGLLSADLDTTVQAMHDHLRRFAMPQVGPERSCRIQFLLPGDQGYLEGRGGGYAFDDADEADTPGAPRLRIFNEENVLACVEVAEAIGAELFTLDAGWWDEQGDWFPSPTRFPRGIEPISAHVHAKGMLFGLYGEIERAYGKGSRIAREHPDWVGPSGILDLTRPEVAAHAESEMTRLIEQYKLDLFRIDFNPLFTYGGAQTQRGAVKESNYWRYYEAFYGMFERVQRRFPDVTLQQCSAGGARNDLGMTSRFHEAYLTDVLWLPHVLQNYAGLTMGTPPERIVIAFGACREGIGYPENFDTLLRCIYALGTPMVFGGLVAPDVTSLSPERREAFRRYGALYREFIRPVLPTSRMFHHAPVSARGGVSSSGWFCVEHAAPDGSKGWAVVARLGDDDSDVFRFTPRGLDPSRTYRLTFDSTGRTAAVDGLRLIQDGLPVRLEMIASSELLLFEET